MATPTFDKKIYLPVIGILLVAVIALLTRFVFVKSARVNAKVSKNKLLVNETFAFEDNSEFAKKWKWEFGDGVIAYDRGGSYQYTEPGSYMIRLTLNDVMTDTFYVSVRDTTTLSPIVQDSLMQISGPEIGMQFENLIFRAEGKGARLFHWQFGDDKREDSRNAFVFHTYDKPGNYIVELFTDVSEYPIRLPVKILPAFEGSGIEAPPTATEKLGKADDDFKFRLQQIADHKDFEGNYRYLLSRYLCGNEKVVVMVNGGKYNEFFTYCAGLHYDKNIYIQQVKVSVDTAMTCVTRVEVSQQTQTL